MKQIMREEIRIISPAKFSTRKFVAITIVTLMLPLMGCNATSTSAVQANISAPSIKGNTPPVGDELSRAKKHFRDRNFGLSEEQFRAIVEREPANAEAWLGLAASYDQLRRFELADRAYKQVRILSGPSAVLHNNTGMSYMLRGNRTRARAEFLNARRLDPTNEFVRNNLAALGVRG